MKYIIRTITESEFEVLGHEVEFGEGKKYSPIEIDLENRKKSRNNTEKLIEQMQQKGKMEIT